MESEKRETLNVFQLLTTILALILPIVQFFFNFAIDQDDSVFLFQNYFIVTSIIAAVLSYVFIIAYSNVVYFEIPLNVWQHRKYLTFLNKTNPTYFTTDEVRSYIQSNGVERRPYYIIPQNVYTPLAIILTIVLGIFLYLGIMHSGTDGVSKVTIFTQMITYVLSIALLTVTLAVFYINQNNRIKYEKAERLKFKKLLDIAFTNDAISEYPEISFIAQEPLFQNNALLTLFKCNEVYYKIISDSEVRLLKSVERYNSLEELYNSLSGVNG